MKQEKVREKQLAEQREARRAKNTARKEKRVAKKIEQLTGAPVAKEPVAAPKKEEKKPAAAPSKPAAPAKEEKKAAPAKKVTFRSAPAALRFRSSYLMSHPCFAGRRQEVNNFSPKKHP